MGNWKVVRPEPDGELELYDLGEDPGEKRNLANGHPDMLAEMEKRLEEARTPPRNQTQPDHIWWESKG